jgi:predicted phosphoribosyltransferase
MEMIDAVTEKETQELKRRKLAYRGNCSEPVVCGKTVILIDDGIATGSTMRAAVRALKTQEPARLVVAVPTVAVSTCSELLPEVDELVALLTPERFFGECGLAVTFASRLRCSVRDCGEIPRLSLDGRKFTAFNHNGVRGSE